jgi:hypothetical protein
MSKDRLAQLVEHWQKLISNARDGGSRPSAVSTFLQAVFMILGFLISRFVSRATNDWWAEGIFCAFLFEELPG